MRDLKIAHGNTSGSKHWSNKTISWDKFCELLEKPKRTIETIEEYTKMPKPNKGLIKDVGGFVGGHLLGGRRKRANVECRSLINLDGDELNIDFLEKFSQENKYTACFYTTHSHTPDNPRGRVIFPLTRDVSPDEWVAISRFIAEKFGIDQFDVCSYFPHQLMYWPSVASNGEYIYKKFDGEWLNPDEILAQHPNWKDITLLPTSSRESSVKEYSGKKQADPLTKDGIVGAFCRTYTIADSINLFLKDIYEPTDVEDRYTYTKGETVCGLVVYEDKFAYSHHATDPANGLLLNAFDLVRVHLFDELDDKASFEAMSEFALSQDDVKALLTKERIENAKATFSTQDSDWMKKLDYDKKNNIKPTLDNLVLILENDPNLQPICFNAFNRRIDFKGEFTAWKPLNYPTWADNDIAQLRKYISQNYGIYSPGKLSDSLEIGVAKRKYHPVREYLESLPEWDGEKRVDTLIIDYLNAKDDEYTRAVTRKTIVAAVARIFKPGIKFDTILTLEGDQGKGKSTLLAKLATKQEWFNDGLTLTDMQDKTGAEKLQGFWLMEIGELAGMKKVDLEKSKAFITRCDDKYRASYGRVVECHPRQNVIVATVNPNDGYLRDGTGNRRFWPVYCRNGGKRNSWDLTQDVIDQIWAEATHYFKQGEKLFLEGELEKEAKRRQRMAMEADPREGLVSAYLDKLLPNDWDNLDVYQRRSFLRGDTSSSIGTIKRTEVCPMEIWCECFEEMQSKINRPNSLAITSMLRRLGWTPTDKGKNYKLYGKQKLWVKS